MAKRSAPTVFAYNVRLYAPTAALPRWRVVYYDPPDSRRPDDRVAQTFATKDDATRRCQELLTLFAAGDGSVVNPKRRLPASALLAEYVDPANHMGEWTDTTARVVEYRTRVWIAPFIENVACGQLTKGHFAQIAKALRTAQRSERTVAMIAAAALGAVNYGKIHGYINPSADLIGDAFKLKGTKRVTEGRSDYVSPEEIPSWEDVANLAREVRQRSGWEWEAAVWVSALCGVRQAELLALRVDDIGLDPSNPVIRVLRQVNSNDYTSTLPPKWGSVRETFYPVDLRDTMVRLVERAEKLKAEGKNDLALLWPTSKSGSHYLGQYLHLYVFRPAALAAGWGYDLVPVINQDGEASLDENGEPRTRMVMEWSWHDLRHHAATWWLASQPDGLGLEVADASAFLGHKDTSLTWRTYVSQRKGGVARAAFASRRQVPTVTASTPSLMSLPTSEAATA